MALRCLVGRHDWRNEPLHGGRYRITRCARCRKNKCGPDGEPVMIYVPMPTRAVRRGLARDLERRVTRRVKDDAMFRAADRDLAELEGLLG